VPLARTRSERFDDLVLDAVEHLEQRWADALDGVEFAVEEVPPRVEESGGPDDWLDEPVPLARLYQPSGPGAQAETPRIVLYRKPIEARSFDEADKADLVLDVVIHEVADLLGVTPAVVDPEGHGDLDG
jgi:predicted Zn-dependent protease with MMP-like domain